jgi:hypothetical protein
MSTPESIASAFAKGLMEGLLASKEPKEKRPQVIKQDDVRKAVAEFLGPLVEEPQPGEQMGMPFSTDPDEIAEMTLRRVHEARERAAAQDQEEENPPRPTTYDPNAPNPSPWMSP